MNHYENQEKIVLLADERNGEKSEQNTDPPLKSSKLRGLISVVSALLLLLLGVASDTMPFPFFPAEAKRRGLQETQSGVILAAYDAAKFLLGPLSGLIVSNAIPDEGFAS